MNQAHNGVDVKRRKAVRRHRRERQIVVFGIIIIALASLAFAASAIYRGEVEGPFSAEFNTPAPDVDTTIKLVCPPAESLPLETSQVVLRVNNATDVSGLAGDTAATLEGRGFIVSGSSNWSRTYEDNVAIYFGASGVRHAYTLARQFEEVELILDTRDDITLDLVLGDKYGDAPVVREPLAPELDPNLELAADGECRPANLVVAQPAPRILPENPLADASPSPSPEPEGEGGEG